MIRSLRRSHGVWWLGLALVLPVGLLLALWSRPPALLPTPAQPAGWRLATEAEPGTTLAPAPLALVPGGAGRLVVVATSPTAALEPGLFLYATATAAEPGAPLPADAEPLGRAEVGSHVAAPPSTATHVLLYSTLDEAIVGVAPTRKEATP